MAGKSRLEAVESGRAEYVERSGHNETKKRNWTKLHSETCSTVGAVPLTGCACVQPVDRLLGRSLTLRKVAEEAPIGVPTLDDSNAERERAREVSCSSWLLRIALAE